MLSDLTDAFRFSEVLRWGLTVALLLPDEELCDLTVAFLVVSLLPVVGLTVVVRSLALLLALLFRMFPSPAFLALLLVLFTELLLSVADLSVVALLLLLAALAETLHMVLLAEFLLSRAWQPDESQHVDRIPWRWYFP